MNKKSIKIALSILVIILVIILIVTKPFKNNKEIDEDFDEELDVYDDEEEFWDEENGIRPYYAVDPCLDEDYVEEEKMELNIQSKEILNLIENDWDISKVNLGTRESTCDEYDIYFDEGIEVKTVVGKVFNIVFTDKYQNNITDGLNTKSNKEEIQKVLGDADFEMEQEELYTDIEEADEERFLIGYKAKQMYIFFSNNGVSIYPAKEIEDVESIEEKMLDLEENKDIGEFANNLTDIWDDFDYYEADEEFIEIKYTLKGFCLSWNPYIEKRNIFI